MTLSACRCAQLSWVGKDEIGVAFFYPSNEAVPENRRIEPKTFRPEYGKELRISVLYHARQPDQENELSRFAPFRPKNLLFTTTLCSRVIPIECVSMPQPCWFSMVHTPQTWPQCS